MRAITVLLCMIVLSASSTAAQQQRFLPDVRYFRTPIADPHGARLSVSLLHSNVLETQGPERPPFTLPDPDDAASDVVAAVSIGGVVPLVHISETERGGVIMYADARVFSRFRIEYQSRDDMGQDGFGGGGFEMRDGAWSGRAAIMHRIARLCGGFIRMTGAEPVGVR